MQNTWLAEMTGRINEALLGEISWQDVLRNCARVGEQEGATLFFHDVRSGRGSVNLASGVPQKALEDYANHFSVMNPWMFTIDRYAVGRGVTSDDLVNRSDLVSTEYYNDFLRCHGQESGLAVTIERAGGRHFMLSLLGSDFNDDRNRHRANGLASIAPQLRRVSDYYRRNLVSGPGDPLTQHLTRMAGVGLVVLDLAGHVLSVNDQAEVLLRQGQVLRQSATGLVSFSSARLSAVFAGLQHQISTRGGPVAAQTGMEGGHEVCFLPMGLDDASTGFLGPRIAVLITLDHSRALALEHGLTAAETRVALAVIGGKKPREIAAETGLSVETIRSQLKMVFAKTGAGSQAGLVRLGSGRGLAAPLSATTAGAGLGGLRH